MEWLQGETLPERLWRGKRLGLDEALDILDQMCDALEAAHDKGIVHRDLKPDNVFLVPVRGRRELVKLLDFGVAKLIARPTRRAAPIARAAHDDRAGGRHAGLHRRPSRRAAKDVDGTHRHLRARRDRLRDDARAAAVRGRQRDRYGAACTCTRGAAARRDAVAGDSVAARASCCCAMLEKDRRPSARRSAEVRSVHPRAARHAAAARVGDRRRRRGRSPSRVGRRGLAAARRRRST